MNFTIKKGGFKKSGRTSIESLPRGILRIHPTTAMNFLIYLSQADGQDLSRIVVYPTNKIRHKVKSK